PSSPQLSAPQAQTVPSALTSRPWPDERVHPAATCTTLLPAPMSTYRDLLVVVPSPSRLPAPQLATSGGGATAAVTRAWADVGTAPAMPATLSTSAAQAA